LRVCVCVCAQVCMQVLCDSQCRGADDMTSQ